MFEGLAGAIILVLDIWAMFSVFQSNAGTLNKLLWMLLILLLPVLGLVVWFFMGPKKA